MNGSKSCRSLRARNVSHSATIDNVISAYRCLYTRRSGLRTHSCCVLSFCSQWFQEYPEFQKNPFFISGESYAGIYVPTLSRNVAHGIFLPNQTRCMCMSLTHCMLFDIVGYVLCWNPVRKNLWHELQRIFGYIFDGLFLGFSIVPLFHLKHQLRNNFIFIFSPPIWCSAGIKAGVKPVLNFKVRSLFHNGHHTIS